MEHYRVPVEAVPTWALCLVAGGAAAMWIAAHRLIPRPSAPLARGALFAGRVGMGVFVLLAAAQAAMRWVHLTTNWPLWVAALVGAGGIETVLALYRLERGTVSARAGWALASLRVVLVALVVGMLTQPVHSTSRSEKLRRRVTILVDASNSMQLADPQMSAAQKLRLAATLCLPGIDRPYPLDRTAHRLRTAADRLSEWSERLDGLPQQDADGRARRTEALRAELHEGLAGLQEELATRQAALSDPPADQTARHLAAARAKIDAAAKRLKAAMKLTAPERSEDLPEKAAALRKHLTQASGDLSAAADGADTAADAIDAGAYAALSQEQRQRVDALAGRARFALARHILLAPMRLGGADASFSVVERLRAKGYRVRVRTFARDVQDVDLSRWVESYHGPDTDLSTPAMPDTARRATRGGKALDALASMPDGDAPLARVFLLSDGRFTDAGSRLTPQAARRLGDRGVAVETVMLGCTRPPRDAAVLDVEAPTAAYKGDKITFRIRARLSGLAGQPARIVVRGAGPDGQPVGDPLTENFRVPQDRDVYTTTVNVTQDEPARTGLVTYTAEVGRADGADDAAVAPFDEEAMETNNAADATVSVTDERTKMLLIDSRPRWEYRYLKNLFDGRDRGVRLQYVLLQPDGIAGVQRKEHVAASASRPYEKSEATALPGHAADFADDEEAFVDEWLKFDVIVLGDVGREMLTDRDRRALRRFVADRGGTLIVIAGPRHMPGDFAGTDLGEMLPAYVQSDPSEPAGATGAYRVALTDAGRRHVIMRLHNDADDSAAYWRRSVPPLHWRHPIAGVRGGAEVLAYALPPDPPEFLTAPRETLDDETLARRSAFARKHALVAVQNFSSGRVLMLTFDRTWRMRYRAGDTYHHRFWGQVVRWATADKLPVGTRTVRLGAGRNRYTPGEPVRVRCKLLREDLRPLPDDERVVMTVRKNGRPVAEVLMNPSPTGRGRYDAELPEVTDRHGPGVYELAFSPDACGRAAGRIIAAQDDPEALVARFRVAGETTTEQRHLAADPSLLRDCARRSGGKLRRPQELADVVASMGPGVEVRGRPPRELALWSWWPLLAVLMTAATAEWALRKHAGLA
ncbi:MAG: hypothetical protein ACOC8F_00125 [Planctomycetota bacterium]